MSGSASVIIPAHDEARSLDRLLTGLRPVLGEFDFIVVANGCTDDTSEVARSFVGVTLIETAIASKTAALNDGDRAATCAVRIYLDADVTLEPETLIRLVECLQTDAPVVASPVVRIDERGSTIFARAYQAVWALTDYRLQGHTGSGVFGVSAAGRLRFGLFPAVIADDLYVHRLFAEQERLSSPGPPFLVHAPRTLRAQIGRLRRTMAGEMQLAATFPALERRSGARRRLVARVLRRPLLWPAFVVYSLAYVLGRSSARAKLRNGQEHVWERDMTSR